MILFVNAFLPLILASTTPVVIWHGMGDTYSSEHISWLMSTIRQAYTDNDKEAPFMYSIGLGEEEVRDRWDGIFWKCQ